MPRTIRGQRTATPAQFKLVSGGDRALISESEGYPLADTGPIAGGRRVAGYVLERPMRHEYYDACANYGVLIFTDATKDNKLRDRVVAAYQPYLSGEKQPVVGHVDDNLFGIVPFEIYRQTGKREYLPLAMHQADDEWENPREDGLTPYTRWWLDDMYMVGSLQAHAYRSLHDRKYADRGAGFLLAYVDLLQQDNGLFHHRTAWPFFWVRGNGWAAAGMTEMLLALPEGHPKRPQLMGAYLKMMEGLVECQGEDGMWPQLLDYPYVRPESSGSGMFIFALATGVKEGWLSASPYREAAERGWAALAEYVDEAGRVREVSAGITSETIKPYLCSRQAPVGDYHGQAGVLWAATAMVRLTD